MTPEQRLIAYVRGRLGVGPDRIDNAGFALGRLAAHLDIAEDRTTSFRPSTSFATTPYRHCITHGTRHRLEADCFAGIRAWAAQHLEVGLGAMDDGSDIYIVLGTEKYLAAWEKAVVRIAAEQGHCVECARTGMACLACDPPNDVDMPEPTEPDFDDYS
ncbi:hypothetical protein [Nocardiopsis synnemataformans]|uniref:hypothetical protein n=1 Tax=Nocardiopsis synnemataformans TaxID=61305 RepID=UPI003EB6F69B